MERGASFWPAPGVEAASGHPEEGASHLPEKHTWVCLFGGYPFLVGLRGKQEEGSQLEVTLFKDTHTHTLRLVST